MHGLTLKGAMDKIMIEVVYFYPSTPDGWRQEITDSTNRAYTFMNTSTNMHVCTLIGCHDSDHTHVFVCNAVHPTRTPIEGV